MKKKQMRMPKEEETAPSSLIHRRTSAVEMSEAEGLATNEDNGASSSSSFRRRPSAAGMREAEGMATNEKNEASARKRIRPSLMMEGNVAATREEEGGEAPKRTIPPAPVPCVETQRMKQTWLANLDDLLATLPERITAYFTKKVCLKKGTIFLRGSPLNWVPHHQRHPIIIHQEGHFDL